MSGGTIGDLQVSTVGLGYNTFGRALDLAGTRRVVGAALDVGIAFFDTADRYGDGRSEEYLGKALGARRDDVVVATKFGVPIPGVPDSGGAAPAYVRRAVERSLRELGTDHIDLYQLHRPDPGTPLEATLEVLDGLVRAGTVRHVGCSNLTAEQMREAATIARREGFARFISAQVEYSLVHRDPETDGVRAVCEQQDMALIPYYPLAAGLLTGKVAPGERPTGRLRQDRYQAFLSDRNFRIVERLRAFADERGSTLLDVAIGWLAAQPVVPTVIAGATSPEQVASNVAAGRWRPSPEDLRIIDQITAPGAAAHPPPATHEAPTSAG
jgi:aryl-alcohol dehydrogenase-like predicted oxidoreductase